jgi:hypothetical protein
MAIGSHHEGESASGQKRRDFEPYVGGCGFTVTVTIITDGFAKIIIRTSVNAHTLRFVSDTVKCPGVLVAYH